MTRAQPCTFGNYLWEDSRCGPSFQEVPRYDLPQELESIVVSSMDDCVPYFQAHQNAMLRHQSRISPDNMSREMAVTLEYIPRIGMACAIKKGYTETVR